MARLRVLYVNHVSFLSGAEQSLLALLAQLTDTVEPTLACPPGELAARARELGVDVVPLPLASFRRTVNPLTLSSYALTWMAGTNQFRKIVQAVRPRLIHANSAMAQVYAGSVARKASLPCIWHARDLRPLQFPANTICRGASRVIAVSRCVADVLAANGFNSLRIARVPNGIDAEGWRGRVTERDVHAELGLSGAERLLIMAAQFVPWKRHEDAIRAMPHILERASDARLVLAGSDLWNEHPQLEESLRALAEELDVAGEVLFVGQRDDIPDLMNAAELVLIPSDAEPFGRTALEAMALAKPVIGTRAGGLPEVVVDGKTGLLVVPRFPESLGGACLRLLENPSLGRALGEAGQERVEEEFTIEATARQTREVYEHLLTPSLNWISAS
jgi:glycosyltransferase involved in cell wall biosynthesis